MGYIADDYVAGNDDNTLSIAHWLQLKTRVLPAPVIFPESADIRKKALSCLRPMSEAPCTGVIIVLVEKDNVFRTVRYQKSNVNWSVDGVLWEVVNNNESGWYETSDLKGFIPEE